MTGYTSGKTTHDPEPWVFAGTSTRTHLRGAWGLVQHYDPRPEYDNHNPILVAYRKEPDVDLWDMGFAMATVYGGETDWNRPEHYFHCFTIATFDQVAHARRVLSKLASLMEVTS